MNSQQTWSPERYEKHARFVSDLGMPDMTGWDVAAAIQARWPRLPVGLITGWGETEITREERSRVNFVINKPFDKAVLGATMSAICPRG